MALKILLCHNYYPVRSGEDYWVDNLEQMLSAHGHIVARLSADTREAEQLGAWGQMRIGLGSIHSFETVRRTRALVQSFRPDVAHVSNIFPYFSPALYHTLTAARVPIVQSFHNFRALCPNSLFFTHSEVCMRCQHGHNWHAVLHRCVRGRVLPSLAYALAQGWAWASGAYPRQLAAVHFLNQFTADLWTQRVGPRYPPSVFGNAIDCSNIEPRQDFDSRRLVYMGVLQPWKGVSTLLQAMAHLPDYQLEVIGDGPQEAALRARSVELGLQNVTFTGRLGPERFTRLRQALSLIVPSESHDQYPSVILEAFAHGVPVIGAAMGGIPSLVTPEVTGLLFPAGDVTMLVNHIHRLGADKGLVTHMGQQARRYVEENLSPAVFYAHVMQLYQQALARR